MRTGIIVRSACILAMLFSGCDKGQSPSPAKVPAPPSVTLRGLFLDTDATRMIPTQPQVVRSRFVRINFQLLLDEAGRARPVTEVTLNLFPDVVKTGKIDRIESEGDGVSWVGRLENEEYSHMTMVFVSGVFAGNFASPLGVYEVSVVEGDLYRVVLIDQSKFPREGRQPGQADRRSCCNT